MTETPPTKKRGGLTVPPRGQALIRLQDLEEPRREAPAAEEALSPQGSYAVNTASSNAVDQQSSDAVSTEGSNAVPGVQTGDGTASGESAPPEPAPVTTPPVETPSPADAAPPAVPPHTPTPVLELSVPAMRELPVARANMSSVPASGVKEPTTRITVDLPTSYHRDLSILSAQTGTSIKDLVIHAMTELYFPHRKKTG